MKHFALFVECVAVVVDCLDLALDEIAVVLSVEPVFCSVIVSFRIYLCAWNGLEPALGQPALFRKVVV